MEELRMSEKVSEIRKKIDEKKKSEGESVVKERMKKVLSERDQAMRDIYSYQDETGIPTQEETDNEFLGMSTQQN